MALSGDDEDYKRIMDINVLGVVHCFKHAAKQMIRQGRGGRIIGRCTRPQNLLRHSILRSTFYGLGACSGAGKKGNSLQRLNLL